MLKNLPSGAPFIPAPAEWELTFEDNFETLDLTKWKINTERENGNIRRAAYNVDDSDVIFVRDGKLYIRTLWKNGRHGEGWYTGFLETSQAVHPEYESVPDYRGFSQTGGYFEVRCKVARATGIWSAFWLMPDNNIAFSADDKQWTGEDGLEVDVMESPHIYRFFEKNKNQNIHVLHADGYDDRLKSVRSPAYHVPKMYEEFHTYSFLWEPDKYVFFVDGQKTWETRHIYKGRDMGICKVPEYLLLSTEVAGCIENGVIHEGYTRNEHGRLEKFWCGNPARNDKSKPYDFIVDYVRCYKRK